MFYVFSTMTCTGRPILFPPIPSLTHTQPYIHSPFYDYPLLRNIRPPYAPHPNRPLTHTHTVLPFTSPGSSPLTPGCVGVTPGALLSLWGREERDLTSSLYSKGHSPLYYLLMERSTSMNRKVGTTHNVKRMLLSFLLSPHLYMPCQHSRLLTFLNLTHRISVIERQSERLTGLCQNHILSVCRERRRKRERYDSSIRAEWQSGTKKKLF